MTIAFITENGVLIVYAGLWVYLTRAHLYRSSVGPETPAVEKARKTEDSK